MRFTTLFIALTSATLAVSAPLKVRSIDRFDLYPRALQVSRDIDGDDVIVVYRFRRRSTQFLELPPPPHSSVASQLQPPSPGANSNLSRGSESSDISASYALMRIGRLEEFNEVENISEILAKYDDPATPPKAGPSPPKIQRSPKPSGKTPFVYSPFYSHPYATELHSPGTVRKQAPPVDPPQPQQPRPPSPSPSPPQRDRKGKSFRKWKQLLIA